MLRMSVTRAWPSADMRSMFVHRQMEVSVARLAAT